MAGRGRWGLGAPVALVALGAVLVRGRVRRYEVAERSMQPALAAGDYVIAVRAASLRRGDIVVYPLPGSAGFELVKRIVGVGGETVTIADGRLRVDGRDLAEPWADGVTSPEGTWRLGPRALFVLGDSRAHSTGDSRSIGPIDADTARWRVVCRYWPPSRVGRI